MSVSVYIFVPLTYDDTEPVRGNNVLKGIYNALVACVGSCSYLKSPGHIPVSYLLFSGDVVLQDHASSRVSISRFLVAPSPHVLCRLSM